MALLLNVTNTPLGVGFKNAYARIATVMVSRQLGGGHRVMIDVSIYATVPDDNTQNVDLRRYVVPLLIYRPGTSCRRRMPGSKSNRIL